MTDPMTMHWNGGKWTEQVLTLTPGQPGNPPGEFDAVAAVSARDAWAVGVNAGEPLAEHWNGRTWTAVPSPAADILNAVTATSPDSAWAVGSASPSGFGPAVIEHWDGKTWAWPPGFCGSPSGPGCLPPATPLPPQ